MGSCRLHGPEVSTWWFAPRAIRILAAAPIFARADPRLFADLRREDRAPRKFDECNMEAHADCLTEYHSGRFDGSQMHRSIDRENVTVSRLQPTKVRLLLLITSVWKNRQRRRLLRTALHRCYWGYSVSTGEGADQVLWRFLLGYVPSNADARRMATEEMTAKDDILMLQTADEMSYAHIGDAYELREANPELIKLIIAIRLLTRSLRFDYLLFADDDSFVSIPSALELTHMLPPERVYVGNMIDTIPQRYDAKAKAIRPEYTVNIYLATPSRVPIFAHGMGFIISHDVAKLLGEIGFMFRAKGNDDMLIGMWLRNIEHLYYLHYWPWFHDHNEFEGAFSTECTEAAVVVHRMTPERWRTFDGAGCHICGPRLHPLDVEPDSPQSPAPVPSPVKRDERCVFVDELACVWAPALREHALSAGPSTCVQVCQREAGLNISRSVAAAAGLRSRRQSGGKCPLASCHALCQQPKVLQANSLCPTVVKIGATRREHRPGFVVLIFGSRWGADRPLRAALRRALLSCVSRHLGAPGVQHLFAMPTLPSPVMNLSLRQKSVEEMIRWNDLVLVPASRAWRLGTRSSNQSNSKPEDDQWEEAVYAYADAWRLVEDRFGGTDYILMVDHRSYVNVPLFLHMILPQLPRSRVYLGCLIDESLFGKCAGKGDSHCDYLWRRRVPMFVHGMGILISSDVAQIVASMSAQLPLREDDLPIDVAFGMWIQALEDVSYDSVHDQFHEWPTGGDDDPELAGISGRSKLDISQPLSDASAIVFPMTVERWAANFDASTCTLRPLSSSSGPLRTGGVEAESSISQFVEPAIGTTQSSNSHDCWSGMGGRPEAWHLVCCEIKWSNCWGGGFTEESCCHQQPPPKQTDWLDEIQNYAASPAIGLDNFRRFLNFSQTEMQLLFVALGAAVENISKIASNHFPRFRCLSPSDCAREAFARMYQHFWEVGLLPLRHPWLTDTQDHLFGLALKLRSENNGWGPLGHEHTFERVQLAEWLRLTSEHITPEDVPGEKRCLEWDSAQYSRHYFKRHCRFFDVIAFDGESEKMVTHETGSRRFVVDFHRADQVVPASSIGIVICAQIFEHLKQPFVAMAQLFRAVTPGGMVVWSAPMFSELHGAPDDFYRYTPLGARELAESANFTVLGVYAPGSLKELAGYLVGMTAPYWSKDALIADTGTSWPLQVYMLLQKPSSQQDRT